MEDRQYQTDIVDKVKKSMMSGHKAILVQSCTGSGKTHLAAGMIAGALSKGRTSHFAVHRKVLIKQTAETLKQHLIPYSYVAAGYPHNPYNRVHIASIDTLKSRLDPDMKIPNILWVDECHMANSAGWSEVIDFYKWAGAYVIGLTATPTRTDGTGLGKHFTDMVCGPSMSWLIENNFLSKYKLFSPTSLDLSGIKNRMGDYAKDQLAARLDGDNVLIGDAIKHYKKLADGKLCIAYCVSRKHSEHTAQMFRDAGVPAAHIDGETPQEERASIIRAFANRQIQVLTNVELITTGFDLAAQVGKDVNVEAISLLRPTQSLSLYLQMIGRGLRRKAEPAIILDHANCVRLHGLPDEDHKWTLSDREVKKKSENQSSVPVRHCPMCYFDHRPAPTCPNCGHEYEIKYRKIDQVDGELKELDRDALRQQNMLNVQAYEQAFRNGQVTPDGMEYLVNLGRKRGYKNPEKWAAYIITSRLSKKKK